MRHSRRWICGLAIALTWLGLASLSEAGISVSVGSGTIGVGGTTSIDVFVTSDSVADSVYAFTVEYEITSTSGHDLFFVDNGAGVPADSQLFRSNYLFHLTGSAAITNPPAGAVGPATSYTGLDVSDSLSGVSGPFTRLLTRLQVTGATPNAPVIGDSFTLNLVTAGTTFLDPNLDPLTFTGATSGTVVVTPEPSSLVIFGLGGLLVVGLSRRRNRGQRLS
ncbi:MAG: PEP-CTERM sorting domain-containing protein [Planctomycetota bacterium]|nr:PEP-CTERM sorting domain-containing protein [Planctomycetota bacterium]